MIGVLSLDIKGKKACLGRVPKDNLRKQHSICLFFGTKVKHLIQMGTEFDYLDQILKKLKFKAN